MQIIKSNHRSLSITSQGSPLRGSFSSSIFIPPAPDEEVGNGDNPPITTDLLVYFDPDTEVYSDDIGTLAVNGDSIRQFNDQSGNSNTLNQTVAASQPVYDIGTLGTGLGSLKIDGTKRMDITTALTFEQPDANFTFYLVYKKSALNISHYIMGQKSPLVGNSRIWLRNNYYQSYDTNNLNAFVAETDNTDITILAITINTTGSATENRYKVYKNGSLFGQTTRDFGGAFRFNMFYGVTYSAPSNFVYGGSMLFYDGVHDATQVQTMSDWLNEKYLAYAPSPPITTNLELFIDPDYNVYSDAGTTSAVDGDNVRQVNDQSTNGFILDQSTASNQYIFKNDVLGTGNSGLWVQNSTKFMQLNSTLTIAGASQSISFYAVYDRINNGAINYIYGSSAGNFDRILQIVGNSKAYFQDTDGDTISATSSIDLNNIVIKAFVLNTATDTMTTYLNGTLEDTVTLAKTWGDFNFARFWGENGYGGHIGQTLLYSDAHDATQVEQVSDWLNEKYKIYNQPIPITTNLELYINPDEEVYSDAGTTLAVDGNNIRQANDQSSNNNTVEQSTASLQPVYETNEINANAIFRPAGGDYLSLSSNITLSGGTVYIVGSKETTSGHFVGLGNSTTNAYFPLNFSNADYLYDGTNQVVVNSGYATTDGIRAYVWNFGVDFEVYLNKTSLGSTSATSVGSITGNMIMATQNFSSGFRRFGNVLIFSDAHTPAQVAQISDWLNTKYKIY